MHGAIESLINEILSRRRPGRTTSVLKNRGVRNKLDDKLLTAEVDSFVSELGFVGLGENWAQISAADGKVIAQTILQRDLAYKHQ